MSQPESNPSRDEKYYAGELGFGPALLRWRETEPKAPDRAPAELDVQRPMRAKVRWRANVRQDNLKSRSGSIVSTLLNEEGPLDGDVPPCPTQIGGP